MREQRIGICVWSGNLLLGPYQQQMYCRAAESPQQASVTGLHSSTMPQLDVAIIGAGPGGLTAAHAITRAAPSLKVAIGSIVHSVAMSTNETNAAVQFIACHMPSARLSLYDDSKMARTPYL